MKRLALSVGLRGVRDGAHPAGRVSDDYPAGRARDSASIVVIEFSFFLYSRLRCRMLATV